jgi:hypothetical protein
MPPSNPKFRPYQSRAVVVDPYRGSRQEQGHGQLANTKSWGPGGERPDTIRVLVCWGDKGASWKSRRNSSSADTARL